MTIKSLPTDIERMIAVCADPLKAQHFQSDKTCPVPFALGNFVWLVANSLKLSWIFSARDKSLLLHMGKQGSLALMALTGATLARATLQSINDISGAKLLRTPSPTAD